MTGAGLAVRGGVGLAVWVGVGGTGVLGLGGGGGVVGGAVEGAGPAVELGASVSPAPGPATGPQAAVVKARTPMAMRPSVFRDMSPVVRCMVSPFAATRWSTNQTRRHGGKLSVSARPR